MQILYAQIAVRMARDPLRLTMLKRQATCIRTSRCIIHALYAYNSYIHAQTYRKRRRQLHSIYRLRVLEEINKCSSISSHYCALINFHIKLTNRCWISISVNLSTRSILSIFLNACIYDVFRAVFLNLVAMNMYRLGWNIPVSNINCFYCHDILLKRYHRQ